MVAVRQIQTYIPAGRHKSLRQGKLLCVKNSVTKAKDANTMNLALGIVALATVLVGAISITRR